MQAAGRQMPVQVFWMAWRFQLLFWSFQHEKLDHID
jgi:hypothetical protein